MRAVILAAGTGSRLAPLTNDRPKPLVEVGGRPLLFRTIDRFAEIGVRRRDVIVVSGYRDDVLRVRLREGGFGEVQVVFNPHYHDWQNFWSVFVARETVAGDAFIQMDGDLLLDGEVLPRLLAAPGPVALATDIRRDLDGETMKVAVEGEGADRRVVGLSKALPASEALGESVGLARIDREMTGKVFAELAALAREGITNDYYERAYLRLAERGEGPFRIADVTGCLAFEIDDHDDLRRAEDLLARAESGTR